MNKILKKISVLSLSVCLSLTCACDCTMNDDSSDQTKEELKDTTVVLSQSGETGYSVVLPTAATEAEEYASQILCEQFNKATGATLSVTRDGGQGLDEQKKVISLGKTSILSDTELDVSVQTMNYDGFRIKRYGNTVVLCGGTDSGTIYSVGEFLHHQFAYEVYSEDETYLEQTSQTVYLKDFDVTDVPDFWGRDMDGYLDKHVALNTPFRMRNSKQAYAYMDFGSTRDWIPGNCHTFYKLVPPEIYEAEHSDWYFDTQMCLTNEDLIAECIKNLKQMILDNPHARIINISEEDFGSKLGQCCDPCRAELKNYGMSGYLLRFCNKIINAIESWLDETNSDREFYYTTFAYTSGTIIPPVESQSDGSYVVKDESCRPHEKLYIRLAPLDPVCYAHALDDESCKINQPFAMHIKGWSAITDRFMVWDYDANYYAYFSFHNTYDALQRNLKLYKDIGVVNIYRQNTTGVDVRMFASLDAYLNSKLMWNVDQNVEELIVDFFEKYYKSGATYMLECLNLLRSHCQMRNAELEEGFHFTCYQDISETDWPIRILEQALELIEKASATYEPLKNTDSDLYEKLKLRALQESVCIRWMILENYSDYYNINSMNYVNMIDQFEKDAKSIGATEYRERKSLKDWIAALRSAI